MCPSRHPTEVVEDSSSILEVEDPVLVKMEKATAVECWRDKEHAAGQVRPPRRPRAKQ